MEKEKLQESEEMRNLVKKARNKELFTIDEQIAYSRYKGITISQKEEPIVRDLLTNWTYYFKVTAYRKNFGKDSSGKYVNTSFIQLADLAYIDRHLRQILGRMIFEIEHFLKTLIITSITNSKEEDGYQIVKDYDAYMEAVFIQNGKRRFPQKTEVEILAGYVKASERIMNKLRGKFNYDQEFYDCHHQKLSIWALLEVMSLANLDRFIGFYCKKKYFGYQKLKTASNLLRYVTNVRNAATHSRPLISNVVEPFQYGKKVNSLKNKKSAIQLTQFAKRAGIESELRNKALTNMKVNDIVATIYLHDRYVKNKGLKNRNAQELKNLLQVIKRNQHMYAKNKEIRDIYYFFELIVTEYS